MNRTRFNEHKLSNLLQSGLLLGAMTALLALLGGLIAGAEGIFWTVVVGIVSLVLAPRLPPRVLLRMYGAQRLHRQQAPRLYALTEALARRAGLTELPRLYYLPSRLMNAFTLGHRDDAAVVLSDGLLHGLDVRELAGVVAHEISHIKNNDMWVMSLADMISRLTSLLALAGQLLLLFSLPLLLFGHAPFSLLAVVLLLAAPTASALLQLALSRTREFDADLEAAALTGDPHGLASALQRLEYRRTGWLERLFFPGRRVPEPSLLRTHPSTDERVERLLSLAPRGRLTPMGGFSTPGPAAGGIGGYPRITRAPRWHVLGLWF